ncbi:site-specific integrase [Deinococcus alpinitundrae]|uniref:site-specific integrase n=1 Tax=Deinococcus alpinitundrae TaxID=468913 RepID=UPI00137ABFD2|nr:site-specific integrase [Deinococcus alpinitundrae]
MLFDHLNASDLGASSQRQRHQSLLTSLGEAFQLELVTRNVAELIRPNPPKRREESELAAFTPEEAALFLAAAQTNHRGEWFVFALSTGMRRGELCVLRWQDINWKASTLSVTETVVDDGGRVIVSAPKTAGSKCTKHLSPDIMQLLTAHRERQAEQRDMLEDKRRDSGRVFTHIYGGTLLPNNMKRDMLRICGVAGVRTLPIHGLRHTHASLSLRRGIPVEVVSKQLGHSSVAFTLRQYRTVYVGEREAWALNLSDILT